MQSRVMREIVEPVIGGMRAEGREYRGFLYVGLMLTCDGPKVIEFNARFGDPEAQVVIPMIEGALAPHLAAASEGRLLPEPMSFRQQKLVGVVVASEGYPGSSKSGVPIAGLAEAERLDDVLVFHAGTGQKDGAIVTAGGRVLTIVGRASTWEQAIDRAYSGVTQISFAGMQYRRDIGRKALGSDRGQTGVKPGSDRGQTRV
jgi:phosphoribosylamine--glycine ligase